jgi:His Kinase A (phospho-acceptor) domain
MVKRLRRKDGKIVWIQLYVFGIPDRGSQGQHTFGMNFDITEKMQAQNELQIAQAELARSAHVSRMGAMTASISHELNQPLGAIMANAGAGLRWMAKTPPDLDEVRESFERIASDAQCAADVHPGDVQVGRNIPGFLRLEPAHKRSVGIDAAATSAARDHRRYAAGSTTSSSPGQSNPVAASPVQSLEQRR